MIRLENLSKYYVGNNEVALGLRKINLEFTLGELVAITGESGSGKSTLLNVLSGSDTYEEGEMFINDKPTSYYDDRDWERYRRDYIGFIYQSYNLIDSYTVFENVNVALVIKGEADDNTEKVMEYLEKVGLREHADKKATQLSSGQKQRLAIARALAKETEIIVADEPTGNLDSENSAEIMALLNELSKDRLVFVVTHNYDEIENYATRKIRMYDGEVAEDLTLRPKKLTEEKIKQLEAWEKKKEERKIRHDEEVKHNKEERRYQKKDENKIITKIVNLNRAGKPVTYALLMMFLTLTVAAFYILLGSFFANLDNTTSKIFNKKNFTNDDITRIIIRNVDDSVLTEEDFEKISEIKYVEKTEMYDSVGDIYYLLEEGEDFKYYYNYKTSVKDEPNYVQPYAADKSKFMKTTSCISEDDLKAGNIGTGLYDIVMYSEDESIIGKEIQMYLGSDIMWGTDLVSVTCTVTGVLEEETNQIYFSEAMAKMLSINPNNYMEYMMDKDEELKSIIEKNYSKYEFVVDVNITGDASTPEMIVTDYDNEEEYNACVNECATTISFRPIFIINEELTYNEAIISDMFVSRVFLMDDSGNVYPKEFANLLKLQVINESVNVEYTYDEDGEVVVDGDSQKRVPFYTPLEAQKIHSTSTTNVIEISKEKFEEMFGTVESTQMAVYIKDYAYAENVLASLKEYGYEAASVYRAAATEYDEALLSKKATSMGISLGALIMLFFIGIYVIGLMMSLRMKDFKIIKLLGMDGEDLNKVNTKDLIINIIIAVVVALAIIAVLNFIGIGYIVDIVKYYRVRHYLIYTVVVVAFVKLLAMRSKKRMSKLIR